MAIYVVVPTTAAIARRRRGTAVVTVEYVCGDR
jgi:hypothetical protein